MKPKEIRECKRCQTRFSVKNYNQAFCTNECRNEYHNDIKAEAIRRYREQLKAQTPPERE